MADQFKIGDVVRLKSGSPKMTINWFQSNEPVECIYFHDNGDIRHVNVSADSLEEAK